MNYWIQNVDLNETKELSIEELFEWIMNYPSHKFLKKDGTTINNLMVLNTLFICHRVNTISELQKIPSIFGIEIDVRDDQNRDGLMLVHDPFVTGMDFEEFLNQYQHNFLIINVKSERIEERCLELLNKYRIKDFFFLDSTFPMIKHFYDKHEYRFATRFSEYEPLSSLCCDWVWVDCFTYYPLNDNIYKWIKKQKQQICIVSPDLHKRPEDIQLFRNQIIEDGIIPEAICCKIHNIYEWI